MKKFICVLALFCVASIGYCSEIYTKIDAQTLLSIMKSEGYAVQLDEDSDIIWKKDGVTHYVVFNKDADTLCYCRVGFSINKDKVVDALISINEYNRTRIFGKSYLVTHDGKHSIMFTIPLNFEGGITKKRLINFLENYQIFFGQWRKEVLNEL